VTVVLHGGGAGLQLAPLLLIETDCLAVAGRGLHQASVDG
jgi:hypothetical protein